VVKHEDRRSIWSDRKVSRWCPNRHPDENQTNVDGNNTNNNKLYGRFTVIGYKSEALIIPLRLYGGITVIGYKSVALITSLIQS
jgi:hypothetical protein